MGLIYLFLPYIYYKTAELGRMYLAESLQRLSLNKNFFTHRIEE